MPEVSAPAVAPFTDRGMLAHLGKRMKRIVPVIFILVAGSVGAGVSADTRQAPAPPAPPASKLAVSHGAAVLSPKSQNDLVARYCATCHSERGRAGGLTLAQFDAARLDANGEVAEKMIRKLRAGMMPPPGASRPDAAAITGMVHALETAMDSAAALNPRPGWRPFQRLNRVEYAAAVRDLLGLDVDVNAYLPPDTMSAGFDNVADVQSFSPQLMQGYLRAASQISRLAVGDRNASATSATYKIPHSRSQMARVPGAPLGTRGGASVTHVFPADGDYVIKVALINAGLGGLFGRTPLMVMGFREQMEVSVDGERVARARCQPDDDGDGLRAEQGPERHGAPNAADSRQDRAASGDRRIHPAAGRPGRRPHGADREHGGSRRQLRLDDAPAHARHDHSGSDPRDRRVGHRQPAPHLHVPPDDGEPGRGVCDPDHQGVDGASLPGERRGAGDSAGDAVLRAGSQERRLRERHPHGAAIHSGQPAVRLQA